MIGKTAGLRPLLLACSILATVTLASSGAGSQLSSARSEIMRLDVTRDAWVSEVGREADGNNGGAPRLKLKSIQEMSLIDIDARPLVGRTIRSAVLHLKKAGDEPLKRVTVSSVGAEWFEGTGSSYAIQPGGATFRRPTAPRPPLVDRRRRPLPCGPGQRRHNLADGRRLAARSRRLAAVPVDPRVVAARVAGLSHGFLVFDDTGSEWTRAGETFTLRLFPNRFVYSREQNRRALPISRSSSARTTASPPRLPAICACEPETDRSAGRRGIGLVGHAAGSGPAGTLGFFVDARWSRAAARADPTGW